MYQEYLNHLHQQLGPLTSDDLKDLLNNEDKLDEKVDEVLEILKTQKDSLLTENRTKAEKNIEKEPLIIELRSKVNELMGEGKECCTIVQEKLSEVKEKSGNVSQETALALLQTAAAESEEQSESFLKQFTDNELPVETFLEEFLAARKSMHLRKLKSEKMQELIRQEAQMAQRGSSGVGGGPAYSNLGPSGFYPASGGVPYPIGPLMPMPPPRPY